MALPANIFGHPEEVLKIFQGTGAASNLISGAGLDPEQQEDAFYHIRAYGVMLADHLRALSTYPSGSAIGESLLETGDSVGAGPALVPGGVRFAAHQRQLSGKYSIGYLGDTITRAGTEGTPAADQYAQNAVRFVDRLFSLEKLHSAWGETTDFWMRAVMANQLQKRIGSVLIPRLAHDFEDLALNGDVDLAVTNNRTRLLRTNDGWLKQVLAECETHSHEGLFVNWNAFAAAVKNMETERGNTGMVWWMNDHVWLDWLEFITSLPGGQAAAVAAMRGQAFAPFGKPAVRVPLIPRNLALPTALATPARVRSTNPGPYEFLVGQNTLRLNIEGQGNLDLTFDTQEAANIQNRLYWIERLVATINAALVADANYGTAYGGVARVGQHGYLELETPNTGVAQTIVIAAAPNSTALDILGLTAGTTTGANAAAGNARALGTVVMFGRRDNFVWHVSTAPPGADSTGLRFFSKFEQGSDEVLTDVWSYQDATVSDPKLTYAIRNVRVARAGESALNP